MIILPSKQLDLRNCTLNVASTILTSLKRHSARISIPKLLLSIQRSLGEDARLQCHNALSLLFLLGKVSYLKEEDIIVMTNSNEKEEQR